MENSPRHDTSHTEDTVAEEAGSGHGEDAVGDNSSLEESYVVMEAEAEVTHEDEKSIKEEEQHIEMLCDVSSSSSPAIQKKIDNEDDEKEEQEVSMFLEEEAEIKDEAPSLESNTVEAHAEHSETINEEDSKDGVNLSEKVIGASENEIKISEEDRQMISSMFEHFDSDNTGAMSIAELGNFMRAIGMFPTDDEVDDLLSHMDEDRSGMVDREELTKHMALQIQIRKEMDPEHDFKEAFLLFDKDGNGKISRDELTNVLTAHGRMKVSLEEAAEYIAMVDTDSDGMLDYSEFVTLFTQKIGL